MSEVIRPRNPLAAITMTVWAVMALLGLALILAALGWSDPVEPEDWLLAALMLATIVALPTLFAILAYRSNSTFRLVSLLAGAVAWIVLLYWMLFYA